MTKAAFGVRLEDMPLDDGVPFPVRDMVAFLTANRARIQAEGIFRVSGSATDIDHIKQQYTRGARVDLAPYAVHTVAGVLRAFFRALPVSLVSDEIVRPPR